MAALAHLTAMDGGNAIRLQEQSLPCAMAGMQEDRRTNPCHGLVRRRLGVDQVEGGGLVDVVERWGMRERERWWFGGQATSMVIDPPGGVGDTVPGA